MIGNRTRRIAIVTVPCRSSGSGVGDGFGFCAATDSAAAERMTATDKYLTKNDVTRADIANWIKVRELTAVRWVRRFDAFDPELVALSGDCELRI